MSIDILASQISIPWSLNPTPARDKSPMHSLNMIATPKSAWVY